MRFEVSDLVSINNVRDIITQNNLNVKYAGYCDLVLVMQCGCLYMLRKVINNCQNVLTATLSSQIKTNYVYRHAPKKCICIYHCIRFAVSKLRYGLISKMRVLH